MRVGTAIILFLLFAIGGFVGGYKYKKTDVEYVYKYDTIVERIKISFPEPYKTIYDTLYKPYYKDTGSTRIITNYDTLLRDVDTAEILKDFFAVHYYTDTFPVDTFGLFYVNQVVAMNRIRAQGVEYAISIPEKELKNNTLYGLGAFAGFHSVGIEASYLKNTNQFTLGYDIYNKNIIVGFTKHFKDLKIWEK